MKQRTFAAVVLIAGVSLTSLDCSARTQQPLTPDRKCSLPLTWQAGQPRPQGVRVENRSDREVLVFLDQCDQHQRVGIVAGSSTRTLVLPARLVPYAGGLRFLIFPGHQLDTHFGTVLPLDSSRVLALTVPEQPVPACQLRLIVDGKPFEGGLQSIRRDAIKRIELVMARTPGIEEGEACPHIEVVTRAPSIPNTPPD